MMLLTLLHKAEVGTFFTVTGNNLPWGGVFVKTVNGDWKTSPTQGKGSLTISANHVAAAYQNQEWSLS